MENLNKESFWNEMYEKYPKAMKQFCLWIDDYKKKNNWDELFNSGYSIMHPEFTSTELSKAPKFHDLPLAMQMGIWNQYANTGIYEVVNSIDDSKETIKYDLELHESQLNKQ